jgi:hypothetical protein
MVKALITGITGEQWAYLAGIFDGEGSVQLSRAHNRYGSLDTYQLCATVVCGTNLSAIEAIKKIVGQYGTVAGHGRKLEPINGKGSRRQAWRLRLYSGHAAWFLKGVRPYLLMKSAQADLGIAHQAAKPIPGSRCSDVRAARERAAKQELTVLNQRGVQ